MKTKTNKIATFCFTVLVLLILFAVLPGIKTVVSADLYYGTAGDDIEWNFYADTGLLEIYGTGEMYDWKYNTMPWYN